MKNLLPILFMLLFLGIVVGANIYLSRRFGLYFNAGTLRPLYLGFALLTVFMIGGLVIFTNATHAAGQVLYMMAAVLLGFTLYLLFSVLLVDLLALLVNAPPLVYGIAALLIALCISLYGILNAFNVRTRNLEVEVQGLGQELRVVHWTDVHLGHFRGEIFLQGLVEKTNAEKPDMVLITGDLFDGKIRFGDKSLEVLRQLEAPAWFVAGNHDGYSGVEEVKQGLRDVGVHVLSNQVDREGPVQLIGLNHMLADENSSDRQAIAGRSTIKSVLDSLQIDPDIPSVFMHHSPDGIDYAQQAGVDLYLCGHTHAGQLFPVTLIGELIYDFNRGLHNYKGTWIYVGEGAGTFGPPMRVGTRSSITNIVLKPEE